MASNADKGKTPNRELTDLNLELASDDIPVLRGVITGAFWYRDVANDREYRVGQIKVPCPFCKRRGKPMHHLHGWDIAHGSEVLSHKAAHCYEHDSPLLARGYYVGLQPGGAHVVTPGKAVYRPLRRQPIGGVSRGH